MNRRLLIFICMFHAAFAHGYDRQRAKTSLAGELTSCAAYFIVVSEFVEHRGQAAIADNVAMTAEVLMDGSAALIGEEATEAGYKTARKDHLALLLNPSNFTVMLELYQTPCLALFRDPGARMQYWLDR
jgi:hypothetical protein